MSEIVNDIPDNLLEEYINVIKEWSGIEFSKSNLPILKLKISARSKETKLSPNDYLKLILLNREEMISFIDYITTNFTRFFRHKEQFDLMKNELIPILVMKRKQQGKMKLKLWSAGCATGEEPYSMLISVLESFKENNIYMDFEIIASDISLKCIEIGQEGIYSKGKFSEVDSKIISTYFDEVSEEKFKIKEELKKYIRFDFHNLLYDNGLRKIDIVMCRNVLIYMDEDSINKVINNIYTAMENDGYLFLSPTESLFGLTNLMESVKLNSVYYYIKKFSSTNNNSYRP